MVRAPASVAARLTRREAWQTRVGRRILLLFVVSALLPVTVLAVAAYRTVGAALDGAAREQAQLAAKRLGLVVSDRLDEIDRSLVALARDPAAADRPLTPGDPVPTGFAAIMVRGTDGTARGIRGSAFSLPDLTVRQSAHLAGGSTLLVATADSAGTAILMARRQDSGGGTVWGRVSRGLIDTLLAVESADPVETRVCIVGVPAGIPIACQLESGPMAPAPLRPALGDSAIGVFEWSLGEPYVAGFWSLFLDFRYAAGDWRVIYSQSKAGVLAPLARFRQTFSLAAVLAILTVALLSSVQIRRTMDPLRALHEGTIRVGRREFDQPVELGSGDELEDVARGFNEMAQRLKGQFAEAERLAAVLQKMSDELRAGEAQLRAVLESAADGIVAVGADGRIRSFNRAAERLFGWTRAEADGRSFADLFAVSLGEGPAGLVPTAGVGSASFEVMARRRDGSTFASELTFGVADAADEVRYTVFVRDIGDRKRAAEEQERLEAQLRHAQKMETIGTLAGGIAHDFNNLLMPIMGHLELVLAGVPSDSEMRADLEPMRDAARRARDLVQRILTFSRGAERAFGPVDLGPVVEEAVRLLRSSIPSTIAIRAHVAPDLASIDGDGSQLHQVLMNLCTNGYHAMREHGGTLEIRLDMAPLDDGLAPLHAHMAGRPVIRLSVRDTGHGMDRATLERVFEPFFTTKPAGEGTGLGMSIVHGVVTGHRGAITVDSEPGRGTVFTIYLPPGQAPAVAAGGARAVAMTRGHGHVLVVDDDEVVGRLVSRVLERAGYRVTCTMAPAEALSLLSAGDRTFDLLITDQTMPGMTGTRLAQRVRERLPGFPIILMTGYSEMASQTAVERLGISELLVKPVEIVPLAATVARVLQGARGEPPAFGGVADG